MGDWTSASCKSALATALAARLKALGLDVAVLESDVLRTIFTPHPRYDQEERDTFYRQMAYVGVLLTRHGVPVIFEEVLRRPWPPQSEVKAITAFETPIMVGIEPLGGHANVL